VASRRQFIQSGLALSAASLTTGISAFSLRADETAVTSLRLERFVFDSRFAAAVELARHAAHHGIPLAETAGDLTDLWYHELDLRWRKAPMALAGMTTRGGLFVLETLAADHRMFVVYRGTHSVSRDGGVAHVLSGPAALIARAAPNPGTPFLEHLGRTMTECPRDRQRMAVLKLTTAAEHRPADEEPMFSWIIAPRSPVAATV
jgi:hypothetical protein